MGLWHLRYHRAARDPLFVLFMYNYRKAKKARLVPMRESGRTTLQPVKHYAIEFDLVGLIVICAGLALFLLPFSIYSYQAEQWQSPMIICRIVFGGLLFIAFALYEKFLNPKTFIPIELVTDRTVLGAYILAATLFVTWYIGTVIFRPFCKSSTACRS